MTAPSSGTCAPWVTLAQVKARPGVADVGDDILTTATVDASNLLFKLTQQKFAGVCNFYVRPTARPRAWEERAWALSTGYGYSNTWGLCNGHQLSWSAQCWEPPEIDLGFYPLVSITEVKIDGVVIPSAEYRIDNNKILTRVLIDAVTPPTQRFGWPTCQRLDLPDTETSTFSVAGTQGMPPPSEGVSAAAALAAELGIHRSGGVSRLPTRLQSISRQGIVMAAVLDSMTFLDKGLTGIYEVDVFIRAHNPEGKSRRRPGVWSPELARSRRPT